MRLAIQRLLAAAVDWTLLGSYVIGMCSLALCGIISENDPFLAAFAVCTPLLYFTFLESVHGGSGSIGKKLFGLVVLDHALRPLALYRSALRTSAKLAIPVLAIIATGGWLVHYAVPFFALNLMACLLLPVSIFVGRGAVGFDDALLRTAVVSSSGPSAIPASGARRWLAAVLITGVVAFSTSAILCKEIFGPVEDPITKLQRTGETYQPLLTAIMKEANASDLARFVENVAAAPGLQPFPSGFEVSPTRDLGGTVSKLRGRMPLVTIQVELTQPGYESEAVRIVVLQLLRSVIPNFLPVVEYPGEFVWVNLYRKKVFGVLEIQSGTSRIIVFRPSPTVRHGLEEMVLEPDDPRTFQVILKGAAI